MTNLNVGYSGFGVEIRGLVAIKMEQRVDFRRLLYYFRFESDELGLYLYRLWI